MNTMLQQQFLLVWLKKNSVLLLAGPSLPSVPNRITGSRHSNSSKYGSKNRSGLKVWFWNNCSIRSWSSGFLWQPLPILNVCWAKETSTVTTTRLWIVGSHLSISLLLLHWKRIALQQEDRLAVSLHENQDLKQKYSGSFVQQVFG